MGAPPGRADHARRATGQALAGLGAGVVVLWALTTAGAAAAGRDPKIGIAVGPACFFALAMVATAAMFAAVGGVTSQLAATRRQAAAWAAALLGVAYGLRMVADAGVGLHGLVWVSPLGLVEELGALTAPQPSRGSRSSPSPSCSAPPPSFWPADATSGRVCVRPGPMPRVLGAARRPGRAGRAVDTVHRARLVGGHRRRRPAVRARRPFGRGHDRRLVGPPGAVTPGGHRHRCRGRPRDLLPGPRRPDRLRGRGQLTAARGEEARPQFVRWWVTFPGRETASPAARPTSASVGAAPACGRWRRGDRVFHVLDLLGHMFQVHFSQAAGADQFGSVGAPLRESVSYSVFVAAPMRRFYRFAMWSGGHRERF